MSTKPNTPSGPSDEVDLGLLFNAVQRFFSFLFDGILSVYLYLKKNIFWLGGAVILGLVTGFVLKQISPQIEKLDVTVTPNVASPTYLYDIVNEIKSDLQARDTTFFRSIGFEIGEEDFFDLEIIPLRTIDANSKEEELKFLELLKEFNNSPSAEEIIRNELLEKTTKDHKITFYFTETEKGELFAKKILEYINSNDYYSELVKIFNENAEERIALNDSLVTQIDRLIKNYSETLLKEQAASDGRLVLENQESLDVPSLFNLKNNLLRDTETKKIELVKRKDAVTVISFGQAYKPQKPLLLKKIVFYPLIFVSIFLLFSLIVYLNGKAGEKDLKK
ncbi:hypothetical protein [Muriicola marianensis]|uniref:Polysaccharide chain length determinant N-terminal domain-containing protein n=1 Tax=Muriicola marianensis TaxID=1324801 RepID=A0ABQ1QYX7_9FLAO|nr:hypothetical protein [Muriicola marianensis]GGD49978.1 hypothetical protein GCM10011361_15770 [Muriicola marianensis]